MPRTIATDIRWLERHGQKWRVTVAVPRDMHKILGTRLKYNLQTDSLAVANQMKLKVVADLQAKIQQARESKLGKPRAIIQEALEIAKYIKHDSDGETCPDLDHQIRMRAEEILGVGVGYETVDEGGLVISIYDPKRRALSNDFVAVAHGRVTPIMSFHDTYLEKSLVKVRTKADDIRAIRYLSQWCERESVPQTLQAIDRKTAARFMDQLGALCGDLAARTQNKYLGRLSSYWAFMLQREHVAANPWQGLVVKVPITKHDEEERAFRDTEVRALLLGGAEPRLMDLMLIGALTGARLDAIVDMKVKDVAGGAFTFKPQKKEKTPRDVPIHAALASIVTRRTAGRSGEDPFFPEWPAPAKEGSLRDARSRPATDLPLTAVRVGSMRSLLASDGLLSTSTLSGVGSSPRLSGQGAIPTWSRLSSGISVRA